MEAATLTFSFLLPPGAPRGPRVVVLILERENLERMRAADPFDLKLAEYARAWQLGRAAADIDLVIAYEDDTEKIKAFRDRQDLAGLMKWLERGRRNHEGDCAPQRRL